jgi:pentatricopeptide repeat protein
MGGVEKGRALFDEVRLWSPSMRESTDAGAYTVTINMYLKAGLVEKAAEISDMVEAHEGLILDPALFLAMLRAYSRSSSHAKAVSVYKRMLKCKLTWSASMFNGVIHCCGRALPLEEIIKVFLAMVHAKIPLSSATCNLMMDIFAKAGLLEKAENVFKLAREQGVLNAISYNTIIDAYGKYKEFGKMDAALVEMQNAGFKDHVEAYNLMLDAYGKAGHVHKMENVLERMRRANCAPDLSTFNILINAYGREGLLAELREVREEMSRARVAPSNYTFNTLIHAFGSLEMPDEAMAAFREMQDLGLEPDAITYNCLIAAFEKSDNDLEAARWSLWMTQLGIQ